jgi:hypothetical protein
MENFHEIQQVNVILLIPQIQPPKHDGHSNCWGGSKTYNSQRESNVTKVLSFPYFKNLNDTVLLNNTKK